MKKIILSVATLFVMAVALVSCGGNSPKANAEKFLKAYYTLDFENAKPVATEDTKKFIDMMSSFTGMMPDSLKVKAKDIKVDIKDVKEEGDNATVKYTMSERPDQEMNLKMVKENGKWMAKMTKEDLANEMGGPQGENQPAEEMPAEGDSTGTAPVTVDSTATTAPAH